MGIGKNRPKPVLRSRDIPVQRRAGTARIACGELVRRQSQRQAHKVKFMNNEFSDSVKQESPTSISRSSSILESYQKF